MKYVALFSFALSLLVMSPNASAQNPPPEVKIIKGQDRVMFKKKTVIDFEDSTVEGELVKPEGGYMVDRSRAKFGSLISIRIHFIPEMLKNARKL